MKDKFAFTEDNLLEFYCNSTFDNQNNERLLKRFQLDSGIYPTTQHYFDKRNTLILKIENYFDFCKQNIKHSFAKKQDELELLLDDVFEYSLISFLLLKYKNDVGYLFRNLQNIAKQEYKNFARFLVQKNTEYGNASISDGLHFIGNSLRLNDKKQRLISLQTITDVKFESELDTVKDCLGYAVLGKIIHYNFYSKSKV